LRQARTIASRQPGTSSALRPSTVPVSWSSMSVWQARPAYAQPSPVVPSAANACTTTSVVLSQASVPSASGASVGTV